MVLIYKFTSPSGKVYIGLTSSTLQRRWRQHITLWRKLKRNNVEYRGASATPILFYALDKYPPDQWEKEILIETDDLQYAKEQEIKLIEWYQATNPDFGYNVLIGGQTGWAGKNLSEEHKTKQSNARRDWYETPDGQAWKEELSKKWSGNNNPGAINHPFKGKKHTQETLEIMRQRKLGKKMSEETKQKKSIKMKAYYETEAGLADIKNKQEKRLTEEQKEQISKSLMGHKQTETQKKAVTEANSLQWLITLPTGEQREITNLRQFCKDNKLSQGSLTTYGHSKGYKVQKLES